MSVEFGVSAELVEEFLEHLARRGRGSYTTRSYRFGLRDFGCWLSERELLLDGVSRAEWRPTSTPSPAASAPAGDRRAVHARRWSS
jgi:site-specific recombinase XerD